MDVASQQNGYAIFHSGRENGTHRKGVALILSSEYASGLLSYVAVSPKIVTVRVKTRTSLQYTILVYAPDTSYPGEQYQDFLDLLQLNIGAVQKVQGDFSANVGDDQHSS